MNYVTHVTVHLGLKAIEVGPPLPSRHSQSVAGVA